MTDQEFPEASGFGVTMPEWVLRHTQRLPQTLPNADDRMQVVNELAARNTAEGTGGPFAAVVTDSDTGAIVAAGVNLVLHSQLPTSHAEMVALNLAATRLGTWDLGGGSNRRTLTVNAQPCVMCLGGLLWSGIAALEFAAAGIDVERITGFDEGPVPADWREQLTSRGITVETGRLESEAFAVLQDFRARVDAGTLPLYNGGTSEA